LPTDDREVFGGVKWISATLAVKMIVAFYGKSGEISKSSSSSSSTCKLIERHASTTSNQQYQMRYKAQRDTKVSSRYES